MENQRKGLESVKRGVETRRNLSNQVRNRRRRYRVGTTWRYLGSSSNSGSATYWEHYPSLSFYGIWLELSGFEEGDEVEIEVSHNELLIRNLGRHESSGLAQESQESQAVPTIQKITNDDDPTDQSQIEYP